MAGLDKKRMDTRLVAEMIQVAAVNGYDVAVLLSGDGDFVPAVQAVAALGKQVYLGVWPGQRVARELRAHSFGVLDLGPGVAEFTTRGAGGLGRRHLEATVGRLLHRPSPRRRAGQPTWRLSRAAEISTTSTRPSSTRCARPRRSCPT